LNTIPHWDQSTLDGGLQKLGSGRLTLIRPSTYTDGTTVSGGVLQLGNFQVLGSGQVSVSRNAKLDLNGFATTVTALVADRGTSANSTSGVNSAAVRPVVPVDNLPMQFKTAA
jgi:autotransporter-associated beta strand protein